MSQRHRNLVVALMGATVLAACSASAPPATSTPSPLATITSALPELGSSGAAVEGARVAETSAPASVPPAATPTPTPDPAVWRFEGAVVDDRGTPIEGACVVIGPKGCQRFSPHTDSRGWYFFDVPQIPTVVYDLTFVMEGYEPVFHRTRPTGPTIFNVVLLTK